MTDLTSETFESTGITIYQPARGHRYGSESIALAEFVDGVRGRRLCELGSGVGVISIQIAARHRPAVAVAVELQRDLHEIALKNSEGNGLGYVVQCVNDDIRRFARDNPSSFDVVVANPPFFAADGMRLPPDPQRAAARHELNGTIGDFVGAARILLAPGGHFFVVLDPRRTDELEAAAASYGFVKVRSVEGPGAAYTLSKWSLA